jgi:hypothetical protein
VPASAFCEPDGDVKPAITLYPATSHAFAPTSHLPSRRDTYPAAEIDTTGANAISISGGSLHRPVEFVPAHWTDTAEYQCTLREYVAVFAFPTGVWILRCSTCSVTVAYLHVYVRLTQNSGIRATGHQGRVCADFVAEVGKAAPLLTRAAAISMPRSVESGGIYALPLTTRHLRNAHHGLWRRSGGQLG